MAATTTASLLHLRCVCERPYTYEEPTARTDATIVMCASVSHRAKFVFSHPQRSFVRDTRFGRSVCAPWALLRRTMQAACLITLVAACLLTDAASSLQLSPAGHAIHEGFLTVESSGPHVRFAEALESEGIIF